MATKQDLIEQLSEYDKPTLERLTKYADLMLIPQPDMLVSVTADQMVAKAHQLADIFFPEWTDRGKADFGEFLVEIMANFSEKDFWYLNALANETVLQNMTIYSNAYSRALSLGYTPVKACNAVYRFRLTYDASNSGNAETIPIGGLVIEADTQGLKFTNFQPIRLPATSGVIVVNLVQGEFATETVTYNGKSVRLSQPNIDTTYHYLESDNDEWSQVNTFAESDNTDKVFMSLPNEDGSQRLKFGEDEFGVEPSLGQNMTVRYNYGDTIAANGLPITTAYTVKESPRVISVVTQVSQLVTATEQESLESIKVNAPLFFRTRGRVLNLRDCIEFLESLPTVRKAQAVSSSSTVYFYVVPETVITPAEEQDLLKELELLLQDTPVLGFEIYGLLTQYINLNHDFSLPIPSSGVGGITLEAFALSGSNLVDIKDEIKLLIGRFTDERGEITAYGKNFSLPELSSYLISNIEGLQNIVFNQVAGLDATTLVDGQIVVRENEIIKEIIEANMNVTVSFSA